VIVAGIVIVRLPRLNSLPPIQMVTPQIDGCYYAGLDRLRWVDVFDEDFYTGKVAHDVRELARGIHEANHDLTGITVCRDAEVASVLLKHANRRGLANELIVVRSPQLDVIKGTVDINWPIEWLGYDVMGLGEWSLISNGLFIDPEYYARWVPQINRFGLFDDCSFVEEYIAAYEEAVAKGKSEPLAPLESGFPRIAVELGRVKY
jgi:hypothetical protein